MEFSALFFQALGLFEYVKEGQDGNKTREWYCEWYNGANGKSNFFKGDGFFRKVRKARARTNYPSSFDFHHCRDFQEGIEKKFLDLSKRRDLAIYLASWLSQVIFARSGGKEVRSSCMYPACRMTYGERFSPRL